MVPQPWAAPGFARCGSVTPALSPNPTRVVMPPALAGGGLEWVMEAAGIEPASAIAPERASTSVVCD